MLKIRLRQSLYSIFSTRKRTAQDMLFLLLGYQTLVTRLCTGSDAYLAEMKVKLAQARKKLLQRALVSKELEM